MTAGADMIEMLARLTVNTAHPWDHWAVLARRDPSALRACAAALDAKAEPRARS